MPIPPMIVWHAYREGQRVGFTHHALLQDKRLCVDAVPVSGQFYLLQVAPPGPGVCVDCLMKWRQALTANAAAKKAGA